MANAQIPPWTPTSPLAKLVDLAGFLYDPGQDIIYSRMDALQRPLGYAYAYDNAALLMDAIIDCEPIFFEAQNKLWMIELWKGQYGLETGCEIGVYNRPTDPPFYYPILDAIVGTRPYDPAHGYFYQSADDADRLLMSFTLKRDGVPLFTRGPEVHWWLTGFKWGVFSTPEQLTMEISIALPVADMHAGFTAALTAMGYKFTDDGVNVGFEFATPVAPQPWQGNPLLDTVRKSQKDIVALYSSFDLPNNDPNQIPTDVASAIEDWLLKMGPDFIGNLVTSLFRDAGHTASEVASILGAELGSVVDSVAAWVTNAGYDIISWVESVYAAIAQIFTMNFSSAVEVHNLANGGVEPSTLFFQASGIKTHFGVDAGHFLVNPPATIPAGTVGRFYVKDNLGPLGGEGWATYTYVDGQSQTQTVTFTFGCPTGLDDNYATSTPPVFAVYGKSGEGTGWGPKGSIPGGGHPLYVAYVWADGPPPA